MPDEAKIIDAESLNWIGTRPIRPDGVDKVTSRAKYGVNLRLPEMVFGKVPLTSHSHVRIKSIDASRALA